MRATGTLRCNLAAKCFSPTPSPTAPLPFPSFPFPLLPFPFFFELLLTSRSLPPICSSRRLCCSACISRSPTPPSFEPRPLPSCLYRDVHNHGCSDKEALVVGELVVVRNLLPLCQASSFSLIHGVEGSSFQPVQKVERRLARRKRRLHKM